MKRKFLKDQYFVLDYALVRPKKYFAKNLELCEPKNLFVSTAVTVPRLQKCCFGTVTAIPKDIAIGSQSSKFIAKYFSGNYSMI